MKSLNEAVTFHHIPENEIADRAWNLYRDRLQAVVETEENIGKYLTIDIASGDYEISRNLVETIFTLQKRQDSPVLFTLRIGYPATFQHGIRMKRLDAIPQKSVQ